MQRASRRQAPGTKPEASERARTSGVGDDTTAKNHSGALGRGTGWDVDVGLGSAAGRRWIRLADEPGAARDRLSTQEMEPVLAR